MDNNVGLCLYISKYFFVGVAALGNMMMMITPINCADLPGNCNPAAYYINPIHRNAIVQGSFPRLTIARTKISHNSRGFYTLHYNRYLGDDSQVFRTILTFHRCLWFSIITKLFSKVSIVF